MAQLKLPSYIPPYPERWPRPWRSLLDLVSLEPATTTQGPDSMPIPELPPEPLIELAPRSSNAIQVSISDRWLFLGMTGCGKTTAVQQLIRELRELYPEAATYVLDSKGDDKFDGWAGLSESDEPPSIDLAPGEMQVWRPGVDNLRAYDEWLGAILKRRRPAIVNINELSSVAPKPDKTPDNLPRLLKQGRSLGICCIVESQEWAGVPRQVRNMATHLVRFGLNDEFDARQADRMLGRSERQEPKNTFGFFYSRVNKSPRRVTEYDDYREFFDL